jgi:hypothetical protein
MATTRSLAGGRAAARWLSLALPVWLCLTLVLPSLAEESPAQPSFYRFSVDQDQLEGAVDFSSLNRPLDMRQRVFVKDGAFYRVGPDGVANTADDQRVRFVGVNLAFGANFPDAEAAERIAARLSKLGVNLVRLHHLDTVPDQEPQAAGSLLTAAPYPTLNPVAVKALRGFIDALKRHGVYVNLNLHVGYQFRPEIDGVPALPDGTFPTHSKPLHVFYPRMVALQAEYARQVIAALDLTDDPALAMVEINNESSLLYAWQRGELDRYAVGEYRAELTRQWNEWLRQRYRETAALRSAWGPSAEPGPELLSGAWRLEVHAPAQAQLEPTEDGSAVRVVVARNGGTVIVKQVGFTLEPGQAYVAELEARALVPDGTVRPAEWHIKEDTRPWRWVGGATVHLSNRWQRFTLRVQPQFALPGSGRFGLAVDGVQAPVEIRAATLRQAGRRGWEEPEALEAGTVGLVARDELAVERRRDDYVLFLADRDRVYLETLRDAVRAATHPLVPIAGTQLRYGGLLLHDAQAGLDYDDEHVYIDHYDFPHAAWDRRDWRIRDRSHVGTGAWAFPLLAVGRREGRPYTISEFNQPWPNRFAAESVPTFAVFAAFQDWDALLHFAYAHDRRWDSRVPSGFDLRGDQTKLVSFGQAAWLFRSGAIAPARHTVRLPLSLRDRVQQAGTVPMIEPLEYLRRRYGLEPALAFRHRVQLDLDAPYEVPPLAQQRVPAPYLADTGEFTYDPERQRWLLHAPKAAGIFGLLDREPVRAGPLELQLAPAGRGFVSLLVTPLDDQPLAQSRRWLLTLPGFTLRSQPGAQPPHPQQLVPYPGVDGWWTLEPESSYPDKPSGDLYDGQPPVWMERREALLDLHTAARGLQVYPLDEAGRRRPALEPRWLLPTESGYRLHLHAPDQAPAPWYELVFDRP